MKNSRIYQKLFVNHNWILGLVIILSITAHIMQLDFGAFKRDYFEAHSLGMDHLTKKGSITELLLSIPNSASGVLPLYLYGLLPTLTLRRVLSYSSLLIILLLFYKGSKANYQSRINTVGATLISPMLISATSFCLPEVIATMFIVLFMYFFNRNYYISSFLAFTTFFNRQTFVIHLFNQIFIRKEKAKTIIYGVFGLIGLIMLYKIWGGLVPPKLAKVHMTPSLKASLNATLIFSLYFVYYFIRKKENHIINFKYALVSFALSLTNILLPDLYGGGFIFSRLEKFNIPLALVIETSLLYILLITTSIRVKLIIIIMAVSFITTNYMFLKYVDFYMIGFLGYLHFNSNPLLSDDDTLLLTQSILVSNCTFFAMTTIYYLW